MAFHGRRLVGSVLIQQRRIHEASTGSAFLSCGAMLHPHGCAGLSERLRCWRELNSCCVRFRPSDVYRYICRGGLPSVPAPPNASGVIPFRRGATVAPVLFVAAGVLCSFAEDQIKTDFPL